MVGPGAPTRRTTVVLERLWAENAVERLTDAVVVVADEKRRPELYWRTTFGTDWVLNSSRDLTVAAVALEWTRERDMWCLRRDRWARYMVEGRKRATSRFRHEITVSAK